MFERLVSTRITWWENEANQFRDRSVSIVSQRWHLSDLEPQMQIRGSVEKPKHNLMTEFRISGCKSCYPLRSWSVGGRDIQSHGHGSLHKVPKESSASFPLQQDDPFVAVWNGENNGAEVVPEEVGR